MGDMSNFMIFDKKTGQQLAEGKGLVLPSDQPNKIDSLNLRSMMQVPELTFKVQIPKGRWCRLRRQVMGSKPRLPRKLKKALTHPCTKSKWLQRSISFAHRKWQQYLSQPMQPGQCHTLQARLYLYLVLNGCKYSWRNQTLKCEMPSGVKLSIFAKPKISVSFGYSHLRFYGAMIYPYRERNRVMYLDEKGAVHLYRRLGEQIKETIEKHNNK